LPLGGKVNSTPDVDVIRFAKGRNIQATKLSVTKTLKFFKKYFLCVLKNY